MSGLPKVTITYANGALGQASSSADGLLCMAVCGATAVDDTFALASPYSLRRYKDLETLGITEANNALMDQIVSDFYKEAPEGTQVYIVGYPTTLSMSTVLNKENPYLKNVIEQLNGEIRGLIVTKVTTESQTVENGLDSDMAVAMLNAQALGEWSTVSRYAPIFTILDGLGFNGNPTDLQDLKTRRYNRVGIVIGSTDSGSYNQAVGLVSGRIARASVDNNIGRVADGSVNTLKMYSGTTIVELADIESIYAKRYITFRTFTGISGYFISDDLLATSETDDYNQLTRRRTIDKAYRIAYNTLVERLLDKIPVRSNGTMLQPVVVAWQQMVENAIRINMTASGELSDDGGDGGVECFIDPMQNVLSTSRINAVLRVRPFGYARYIDVELGFTVTQ